MVSRLVSRPDPGGRIRVAHVIQNMNYGGMERVISDLIRRTDPDRFELHLVVLQFLGRFAEGLEEFATLHTVTPRSRASMLWPRGLAHFFRELGPHIVQTHSGVWYKASLAARLARVPAIVHTEHGRPSPDGQPGRFLDAVASRWTTRVVAVSEVLREQLARTLVADPGRLTVITNGIDVSAYRARDTAPAVRAEFGVPPDAPIIGSVGRLERIKGYDVLLEAFALLEPGSGPPPVLVVVGEGALRRSLEARARQLGLEARVHLLGWQDDIPRWLSAYDVFTLASRSEGTSISLLEAMAAGRCPVVTDVGGNRAVLGASLAHRLVPSEDPPALARALQNALGDVRARTRDAAAAEQRVAEAWSLDRTVAAYQRLYEELAASGA
jgi:glycosyltransferase involved in cell wall biosynthesis